MLYRRAFLKSMHSDVIRGWWRFVPENRSALEKENIVWRRNNMESVCKRSERPKRTSWSQNSSSRSKISQCVLNFIRRRIIRGHECIQSCWKRTRVHLNGNSLLCISRSMVRWTIWFKIRHLVTWMCALWNGKSQASFLSRGYVWII